jgi:2-succinyl-5-enolpyruvyl-6-hydroxy-3-cyclohexene-1-carboxylate synthase
LLCRPYELRDIGANQTIDQVKIFFCNTAALMGRSLTAACFLCFLVCRPYELRDTGANQTIDQVKIFGGYTLGHFCCAGRMSCVASVFERSWARAIASFCYTAIVV